MVGIEKVECADVCPAAVDAIGHRVDPGLPVGGAGDRRYDAIRPYTPDTTIARVGDVEAAVRVTSHTLGSEQCRFRC